MRYLLVYTGCMLMNISVCMIIGSLGYPLWMALLSAFIFSMIQLFCKRILEKKS